MESHKSADPFIQLRSGRAYSLTDPDTRVLSLDDIAESLAKQCRFTGHCKGFYSVAEHSFWCSVVAPRELKWECFWHDAAEAIVGDCGAPLKGMLPEYRAIEADHDTAVRYMLGLPATKSAGCHEIDMRMCATEKEQIMEPSERLWGLEHLEPFDIELQCNEWESAKSVFLTRAHALIEAGLDPR